MCVSIVLIDHIHIFRSRKIRRATQQIDQLVWNVNGQVVIVEVVLVAGIKGTQRNVLHGRACMVTSIAADIGN